MNLLIVEDEPQLAKNISSYLQQNLYVCDTAADFQTAQEKLSGGNYDCIILTPWHE